MLIFLVLAALWVVLYALLPWVFKDWHPKPRHTDDKDEPIDSTWFNL